MEITDIVLTIHTEAVECECMVGGNRIYSSPNNVAPKPEENWDTFQLVSKK